MAKKSKKRARQAARRAERRTEKHTEKRVAELPRPRSRLLKRIFDEARDRHMNAAREGERLRAEEARREERAKARGQR